MKEFKLRIEDALSATRAAVEEGHRPRRRCCAAPRRPRACQPEARERGPGRASTSSAARSRLRPVSSPRTLARMAPSWPARSLRRRITTGATTRRLAKYVDLVAAGVIDSREGGSHRPSGCGFRGWPADHDRGHDRREAEEGLGNAADARRRDGLLSRRASDTHRGKPAKSGLLFFPVSR